jgi:hypothetical protein
LAELARRLKADERVWHHALAGFLDTFYTHPERRQTMIDETPPLLGNPRLDASLGAIAEHLARRWELAISTWTDNPERFLSEPYFPTAFEGLKPLLIAQSPLAFRRRLIFVEHDPLSRVRMPRAGPQ